MKFIDRTGETRKDNFGTEIIIIKCNGCSDIIVEFQDKYKAKIHTNYQAFEKGKIKNPYHPNVYGVGYIGQGKYKTSVSGKNTEAYKTWKNMLRRCYDPYEINREPVYIDCYVCDEWLCFQNFAKWFYEHYYNCNNERMHLDKDILCKGNKIYSSENCILVPQRINNLFTKGNAIRGKYPIGVCWDKKRNKFQAYCSILDKNNKKKKKYLGLYDNEYEAFQVYKQFKENYIKQIANEYKSIIPTELYDAMYRYEVEIND